MLFISSYMQAIPHVGTAALHIQKLNMVDPLSQTTRLLKEVQSIVSITSEKFVPAPSKDQILTNLLIGLKRFQNTVRRRWALLGGKWKKDKASPISVTSNNIFIFHKEETDNKKDKTDKALFQGLRTGF